LEKRRTLGSHEARRMLAWQAGSRSAESRATALHVAPPSALDATARSRSFVQ